MEWAQPNKSQVTTQHSNDNVMFTNIKKLVFQHFVQKEQPPMTQINMEMFLKGMLCTLVDPFGKESYYYNHENLF